MMSVGYDMGMQMFLGMAQPCMAPTSVFTGMNVPALQAIHANMNTGSVGPGMIPLVSMLPYQHKPYQTPVNMPYHHNMASSMFQFQ
jgi:hypothetical protein